MQAVCSAVSLLACVPLGELLFFHVILIRKVSSEYLHAFLSTMLHLVLLELEEHWKFLIFMIRFTGFDVRFLIPNGARQKMTHD